jgi:CBS domain-containing protein
LLTADKPITLGYVLRLIGRKKVAKIPAAATVTSALLQMSKDNYEVLLIEPVDNERPLVFSGYSVVSKLVDTKPSDYGSFLASPCLLYCLSAGTVYKGSDLLSLFHVFESTTFGFSMIHDEVDRIVGKITVSDLLPLFESGFLSSNLLAEDVASGPVFSMSKGSKVIDCLREMESRKYRKVRITGTNSVVSDRLIFSHVFDEKRLQRISKAPQHLLDDTLEDLEPVQGTWISGKKKISEAAKLLTKTDEGFLLVDEGILTPWDLIIKPWRMGNLRISNET